MPRMISALEPRDVASNERAVKVLQLAREHLTGLTQERGIATRLALADWNELLRVPDDDLPKLLGLRARELVTAGRIPEAVATADHLQQRTDLTPFQLYDLAEVFGRCAGSVTPGSSGELSTEAAERRARCVRSAVQVLRRTFAAGWNDFAALRANPAFTTLRGEPDFDALITTAGPSTGR